MDQPEPNIRPADTKAATEADISAGTEEGLELLEGEDPSTPSPPAEAVASTIEPDPGRAVIPIPDETRRDWASAGSLWQRIAMRGRQSLSKGGNRHDAVMSRLNEFERRVSESQTAIENQIAALDLKLSQVWEVEEQLSFLLEIQEILTGLQEQQGEIRDRVRSNRRTLNLLVAAFFVTAIAMAGLTAQVW